MTILFITLASLLLVVAFVVACGGRRVVALCALASSLCGYSNALGAQHAAPSARIALVGAAVAFLVAAMLVAVTRGRQNADRR